MLNDRILELEMLIKKALVLDYFNRYLYGLQAIGRSEYLGNTEKIKRLYWKRVDKSS
jgi:hypothetical protein